MNNAKYAEFDQVQSLLRDYAIPMPLSRLVQTPEDAVIAFETLGPPVAVKLISVTDSHKTDKGLLQLNVHEPSVVENLTRKFIGLTNPGTTDGVLIQKMAPMGIEVIAGLVNDPTFGVMLVFGAGGIWVELMDSPILRLAPINIDEARWLIQQHVIARLLNGHRGMPPCNIQSLAQLLVNLSKLGADHSDELDSLDINPVIVTPKDAYAVDFRLKRKRG